MTHHAQQDHQNASKAEAAFKARVEAGGPMAVARAAIRYPFAAAWDVPPAAQDIIRDAMLAQTRSEGHGKTHSPLRDGDHLSRGRAVIEAKARAARDALRPEVMRLAAQGLPKREIARILGRSDNVVTRIINETARQSHGAGR